MLRDRERWGERGGGGGGGERGEVEGRGRGVGEGWQCRVHLTTIHNVSDQSHPHPSNGGSRGPILTGRGTFHNSKRTTTAGLHLSEVAPSMSAWELLMLLLLLCLLMVEIFVFVRLAITVLTAQTCSTPH